ncbi:MAG: protein kinase [Sandaracinaceae bacterium]|nr:protein kinase [Sandaracinaceae bacterium]
MDPSTWCSSCSRASRSQSTSSAAGRSISRRRSRCSSPSWTRSRRRTRRGIVHRDVKPHNVFLSRDADGRIVPKVLDFGLARFADVGAGTATQSGAIMGTPLYMAPEQALGNTKAVGPRSNVWSTAVMVYECLTNEAPFEVGPEAPVTAIVVAVATGDIIPLDQRRPDLPAGVWEVLERALARKPEHRLASITELRDGLMRAAEITRVEPLTATQLASRTSSVPKPRKIDPMAETLSSREVPGMKTGPMGPASLSQLPLARRGWLWGVGVAVILGLAVAVVSAMSDPPAATPPPEPSRARTDSRPAAEEPARQEPPPRSSEPAVQAASPPAVELPQADVDPAPEASPDERAPAEGAPRHHRARAGEAAAPAPAEPRCSRRPRPRRAGAGAASSRRRSPRRLRLARRVLRAERILAAMRSMAAAALLLALALPVRAGAQQPDPTQELLAEAVREHERGRYAEAYALFLRVHEARPPRERSARSARPRSSSRAIGRRSSGSRARSATSAAR